MAGTTGAGGSAGWRRTAGVAVMVALGLTSCSDDSDPAAGPAAGPTAGPAGETDERGFTPITQPEGDAVVLLGSGEDEVRLRDVAGFCDAYGRTRDHLDRWLSLVEAGDPVALWAFLDEHHRDASDVADRISTNATDYHVGKKPSSAVGRTMDLGYEGGTSRIADPIDEIRSALASRGIYDSLGEFETFFEDRC